MAKCFLCGEEIYLNSECFQNNENDLIHVECATKDNINDIVFGFMNTTVEELCKENLKQIVYTVDYERG
jgi:hypothetical protein